MATRSDNGGDRQVVRGQFSLRALLLFVALSAVLITVLVNYPDWVAIVVTTVFVIGRAYFFSEPSSSQPGDTVGRRVASAFLAVVLRVLSAIVGLVNGAIIGLLLAGPASYVFSFNAWNFIVTCAVLGSIVGIVFPGVFRFVIPV